MSDGLSLHRLQARDSSLAPSSLKHSSMHLRDRDTYRERGTEKAATHWFTVQMPTKARAKLNQVPRAPSEFPSSRHLLPSGVCVSRELELAAEAGFAPGTLIWAGASQAIRGAAVTPALLPAPLSRTDLPAVPWKKGGGSGMDIDPAGSFTLRSSVKR